MGPGPSNVEPRVYEAMRTPIVGHLDPYFFEVAEDIRKLLQSVFGTENRFTMVISGTGSAGMEAAVANFAEPGSKFAVFANGFFCDRITEMGRRYGAEIVRAEKPWGEPFGDEEAVAFIQREKPRLVAFVHAETSTGAQQRGKAICDAAHAVGALVIADCVTSLGGMPVQVDETGIDIAYSCTQKGLSCPPGLSPITVSERAMEVLRARKSTPRTWYLDLKMLDEYYDSAHRYHHTAPISMFYALARSAVRDPRRRPWRIVGRGTNGTTWRWWPAWRPWESGCTSPSRTVCGCSTRRCVPAGIEDMKIRKRLIASHGIEIFGGFGPLAGKIFRIGLMGASSTQENVLLLLEALDGALRAEGYTPPGSGVAAAERAY